MIYNPDTGYYYLFLSFGGLDSYGGYNIRVCRSEAPNGPYYDSMGNKMSKCKGPSGSVFSDVTAQQYGTKLMGCYKFLHAEGEAGEDRRGYLSPGHNSCLYQEETGKYFILYHTRFENSGEEHQVRVHQMFFNEDGWPVIAPYRYTGETLAPYEDKDICGSYKWVDHGREISADLHESVEVKLEKNGRLSGALSGSWYRSGENGIVLETDGRVYQGVLHITLANPDAEKACTLSCNVRGMTAHRCSGRILSGEMHALNSFEAPDTVTLQNFDGAALTGEGALHHAPAL